MEMLLMGVCLSMFGLAVACLAFGTATRVNEETDVAAPDVAREAMVAKEAIKVAAVPERFFVEPQPLPVAAHTRVPIEALLLQIENHVRLEHAAAECFLEAPTASLLHSRTMSQLVN